MKYKPLLIAVAVAAAACMLAVAGGPGEWAAAGLFTVVACYLVLRLRRPPPSSQDFGPERFFSDAGEETALPDLRTLPANDARMHPPRQRDRASG